MPMPAGPPSRSRPVVHAVPLLEVGLGDLRGRVVAGGHGRKRYTRGGQGASVRSDLSCPYSLGSRPPGRRERDGTVKRIVVWTRARRDDAISDTTEDRAEWN